MKRLIIFDLDGTLCPKREHSSDPFVYELLPGVKEKLESLKGVKIAIATNQYSRGYEDEKMLDFFDWLYENIVLNGMEWATNELPCRLKPAPAMLVELMERFEIPPAETVFIGDDERDKVAAERAGVQFVSAEEFFAKEG